MRIACIAEGTYVRHTAAMLHSALQHAPSATEVYVLHSEAMPVDDAAALRSVVETAGGVLHFVHVAPADARDLPFGYFPRAVWLRIFLPELVPDVDRVLYLDSDLIVVDDLAPLWDVDLNGDLVGAVTNPLYPFMPDHHVRVGLSDPTDYFNSGVLLMNLLRMRTEGTADQLRHYAITHPGNDYPDQDALNVVCRDRWLKLHPRWNVQTTIFDLAADQLPFPPGAVAEALENPAVVHFIGPFKPWSYMCRHPRRHLYFEHAAATPWGAPKIEDRTPRAFVLRRLPIAWIDRWLAWERAGESARQHARRRIGRVARPLISRVRRDN